MKEYRFTISQKVTVWKHLKFQIFCSTEEEAKKKMEEVFDNPDFDCDKSFLDSQYDYDYEEWMTPEENDNQPTKLLYYKGELIKE